jgi:ferredoxin-nitrate reductase
MSNKKTYKSTCCYCGTGCGLEITDLGNGKIVVEGDKEHPSNRGMLCSKGLNLHYTAWEKSDRLLYPEMRWNRNMPLERVSWDTALERTARVFKTFIDKYGPDSVAFYASGQCLTEEYYVVNKLIKGFIGSNNIDTNSRLCMSSAVVGYKLSLGEDSVPVCYDDIELSDCIMAAGANPAWCHPIIWRRVEAHKVANPDVKIICIDPRKTDTAKSSDLHLQIKPGTDITIFNAIARILIENAWIDNTFITQNTEGYEKLKAIAFSKTIQEAAAICEVEADDIFKAASWIGNAKAFLSMWTMGLNQSVIGVDKNLSLINLHLITGQIGKAGAGPFSLTGQPNAMGGREVGGLSNLLPAHRNLLNENDRKAVEDFWQSPVKIAPKNGLTATEMFEALNDGRLKAIWIMCTNPLVSLPDVRMAEAALKNAKFVVVQEMSNKPETLQYADVILPAATWTEKEGTMTNAERRISYLHKITNPPAEALPDAEIITRFAHKMGFEKAFDYLKTGLKVEDRGLNTGNPQPSTFNPVLDNAKIFAEHAALTKGTNIDISHLNYDILKEKGTYQWGNARLFEDKKFYTPSGKAQIHGCDDANKSEQPTPQYPLILTTMRIRDQWHTMSRTGKVNKLNQHISEPYLEIHPFDAEKRHIKDGEMIEIKNDRGEVRARAKVTDDIKKGVVALPMHWGKSNGSDLARANNITNNLLDPRSKEPDFKFSVVEVSKIINPKRKIVIIGAGAAGCGFINTYRALNEDDEIHVFSREIHPFYNRVMLPDYVSGTQTWEQLQKLTEQDFYEKNITVHKGVGVKKIFTEGKGIEDDNGKLHNYDILILGMGSRANMLRDIPQHLTGIFSMRSRHDADNLLGVLGFEFRVSSDPHSKLKTQNPKQVVVVGGGLLGLEMAASLNEMGLKVSIVQRISRFMDRQLDPLASQLLHEEIVESGIDVFYNDAVQTYFGKEKIEGVRLSSGRKIECDAMVVAVGTTPNMELAREASLACNRGVIINDFCQTSDPSVFAMGEIAEWRGQMWGITVGAEEQAAVAARFLAGDTSKPYNGSLSMNILKMEGLNLCSLGRVEAPENDPNFEEILFIDKAKRYYKKCIIQNDKLVGAILMGDKSEFLEFKNWIQNGIELSEKRLELLRSGKKAEPVLGKLVCSCNGVGQGNLENKIRSGCSDFQQLCNETGAGTGCGSCRTEVKAILDKVKKEVLETV